MRLTGSIETALRMSEGTVVISVVDRPDATATIPTQPREWLMSEEYACVDLWHLVHGTHTRDVLVQRAAGRMSGCSGLGTRLEVDPDMVVPKP